MSMTFWDTIKGHHLADTLIHCLPKLAEEEQKTYRVPKSEVFEKIEELIKDGKIFVSYVENGTEEILLIMKER